MLLTGEPPRRPIERRGAGGRLRAALESLRGDPLTWILGYVVLTLPAEISARWIPGPFFDLARIGMLVGLGALGLRVIRGRPLRSPPLALSAGALAIVGVEAGSWLLTRWPNAPRQVLELAFFAAFGFLVLQVITDRRRLFLVAACLMASGLIEALVILAQQVGDFYLLEVRAMGGRRNGTYVDPNIATRVLLLTLIGALAAVRRAVGGRLLPVLLICCAVTAALVLTFSRSGWLLLAFVAIASLVSSLRDRRALLPVVVIALTFTAGVLLVPNALQRATDVPPGDGSVVGSGAVATLAFVSSDAAGRPASPSPTGDSSGLRDPHTPLDPLLDALPIDEIRRYLARAGVAMFLDHPLAGVGVGGFQPMLLGPYREFIAPDYRSAPTSLAHTDIIRIAAEEGLIGLAAISLFFAGIALAFRRALQGAGPIERIALLAIGSGLIVITLAAQTEGRFYNEPYLWLLVGALAALASRPAGWSPGSSPGVAAEGSPAGRA